MSVVATQQESVRSAANWPGLFAITALVYVLCDLLHELGHAAATLLPLGVKAVTLSTIGLSSIGSSAVVAVAGPLVNLVLALTIYLARVTSLPSSGRYFFWLFGTVNLLNATAYPAFSAMLGSGDWAVVFNAFAPPLVWRPVSGVLGLALYYGSLLISRDGLRHLCASGVIAAANVERYCAGTYWLGGLVLTAGAVFNPVSPWFILTSGAASGFGAMLGLLALPVLLHRSQPTAIATENESLQIGWPWLVAGAVATIVFVGVVGPGIRFAA